ncbi:MAG: DNA primase [Deltaproteobacteria bacterium]|nr:DNA primase [Deltaproteobacteria bacterium]
MDLFSGREDCFARQWANRAEGKQGYVPVRRPMEEHDVEEHLSGKKTYGIYLLHADSTVKVAVIDVDMSSRFRQGKRTGGDRSLIRRELSYLFSRMNEICQEAGLYPVVEFSGAKGYHFWFFFEQQVPAAAARRLLGQFAGMLQKDLNAFHLEVFPKQDRISGKGFGNLVKLPLGIHRLTGKRSYFLECHNRSQEAQLAFLSRIKKCRLEEVSLTENEMPQAKILIHPKMSEWAKQYPELISLEMKCPPLGQIIASCRNGNQPSLREEKVLFQTIGFLASARTLLHHLLSQVPEYNQHLVDYKISRLRGTPLGCRRIHSLLSYEGDLCPFERSSDYPHPLLHLEHWREEDAAKSEKITNLRAALENLRTAIMKTEAFLK